MITVILAIFAFLTGLIIGYQAYEANLKREGWVPTWDFNKPIGEGRLTMIEPIERMTPAEIPETLINRLAAIDKHNYYDDFLKIVGDGTPKKGRD